MNMHARPKSPGEMSQMPAPRRPASYDKKVALVLQGGGALGSYQAGVYEALAESEYLPDWVCGISIGAINCAIIAGNAPDKRVERLREFWEGITATTKLWPDALMGPFADTQRAASAASALVYGQPGFFAPRPPYSWIGKTKPTSYYDTAPLKTTLERLVDFDRINSKEMRFAVGAVNVRTGSFSYFDNARTKIRAEHVVASGSLPPGFPSVEIDGEHYWDGGLVSNTPLEYVVDYVPRRSRLTFQVDLFHARGQLPKNLEEVAEREKDIRYSSRTRTGTNSLHQRHDVRHNINALYDQLPDELKETPEAKWLYNYGCVTTMDIVQLIYRPHDSQGATKDYEFGRATMNARWKQGLIDAKSTLVASPWLAPMPREAGARVFDVMHDMLTGKAAHTHDEHDLPLARPLGAAETGKRGKPVKHEHT
jgi:NTE family protein